MSENQAEKLSDLLVTISSPRSPMSEAYRTLRTNLQFVSLDKPLQTLMVTSPGPEEGKSTLLANLAVAMAQGEKKVILADCDLRRPSLHKLFGLMQKTGLTTMMLEDAAMSDPPLQNTAVPGLQLLASGPLPPSPPDLLGSRRMDRVLDTLKERGDIVLIDAPPVVGVSDAAILATKVDGVLLVVSAGQTKRESVQRSKVMLEKVNANLIGAALTNVPLDASLERYYYSQREETE
ncbi:MAG: CpsD/CapB family tyrosine-protein kinase [Anaerolineales bacterium]|jgi:non-specific protein-tyrosine kinase|nr:MAG: CpsD/CapB family tyrosine-protein kinase [Anaerolineales bacterium]